MRANTAALTACRSEVKSAASWEPSSTTTSVG